MPKIKIKNLPEKGDQNNYELDGNSSYNSSNPNDDNKLNTVYPESDTPNVIAEKGETILYNNDGDLSHLKIEGKKHSKGGTPINVPNGSFIFSDDKKLSIKDPEILKIFELSNSKKGYTPAKIAKKYKIDEYSTSQKDKDKNRIAKDTSQLNSKNSLEKLVMLANIQESMKGFPTGPVTYADDELIYAETGGNIDPKTAKKLEGKAISEMRATNNVDEKIQILNKYKTDINTYRSKTPFYSWGWVKGSDENTFSDINMNLERKIKYLENVKNISTLEGYINKALKVYSKDPSVENLNLLRQAEYNYKTKTTELNNKDVNDRMPYVLQVFPDYSPVDFIEDNIVNTQRFNPVTGPNNPIDKKYNDIQQKNKIQTYPEKQVLNTSSTTSKPSTPKVNNSNNNSNKNNNLSKSNNTKKINTSDLKLIGEIE